MLRMLDCWRMLIISVIYNCTAWLASWLADWFKGQHIIVPLKHAYIFIDGQRSFLPSICFTSLQGRLSYGVAGPECLLKRAVDRPSYFVTLPRFVCPLTAQMLLLDELLFYLAISTLTFLLACSLSYQIHYWQLIWMKSVRHCLFYNWKIFRFDSYSTPCCEPALGDLFNKVSFFLVSVARNHIVCICSIAYATITLQHKTGLQHWQSVRRVGGRAAVVLEAVAHMSDRVVFITEKICICVDF